MALVSIAAAADIESVERSTLGHVGEEVGGGRITRIERHPEFERYYVVDPAGLELPIEVVIGDGVHQGLCANGRLVLYPRYELVQGTAKVDPAPFCTRLAATPPPLSRLAQQGVELPEKVEVVAEEVERVNSRVALRIVGVLAALGGLFTAWSARRAFHWGLFVAVGMAALTRYEVGPAALFNGAGAGYEKLMLGWGLEHHSPYGEGFAVVMAPFVAAFGAVPEAIFIANTAFHLLAAAALWALLRGEGGALVATCGAVAWTLLPVPARLAASEAMHGVAGLLWVAALACAGAWRRGHQTGGVAAALLVALAINTRPESLPLTAVVVLWAWPRRGWLPAGIMGVAVVARVLVADTAQHVVDFEAAFSPTVWRNVLSPQWGPIPAPQYQMFWVRVLTPFALWPLALWGIYRADPALRLRLLGWIVLGGAIGAIKAWPLADGMRLQAPVLFAWAAFAGIGVAHAGRLAPVVLALAALTRPNLPRWAQAREFAFLQEQVPKLTTRLVRSESTSHRSGSFMDVMDGLGPARWSGVEGQVQYVGLSCYAQPPPSGCVPKGCPLVIEHVEPITDLDVELPAQGVEIGFWGPCPLLVP